MAANDFFSRWARKPTEEGAPGRAATDPSALLPEAVPESGSAITADSTTAKAADVPPPPPTMADVEMLHIDSDYKPFVARGVDESIRRSAMKKLFTDPHFNIMDGLDTYIEDFNKFEPIPEAMLATLEHAKGILDPLSMFRQPVMQMISTPVETVPDPDAEKLAVEPDQEGVEEISEAELAGVVSAEAETDAGSEALAGAGVDAESSETADLEGQATTAEEGDKAAALPDQAHPSDASDLADAAKESLLLTQINQTSAGSQAAVRRPAER